MTKETTATKYSTTNPNSEQKLTIKKMMKIAKNLED